MLGYFHNFICYFLFRNENRRLTSNGSHVTVLSMFSRSLKMENSHNKELNISGRKKQRIVSFYVFLNHSYMRC